MNFLLAEKLKIKATEVDIVFAISFGTPKNVDKIISKAKSIKCSLSK